MTITQQDYENILSAIALINDKIGYGTHIVERVRHLESEVEELSDLADLDINQSVVGGRMKRHPVPNSSVGSEEYYKELAAATAEAEGHTILTPELKGKIEQDAVTVFLNRLSLQGAIELVQGRMPRGVRTVQVEA